METHQNECCVSIQKNKYNNGRAPVETIDCVYTERRYSCNAKQDVSGRPYDRVADDGDKPELSRDVIARETELRRSTT